MLLTLRKRTIMFCICAAMAFVYLFTLQVHASEVRADGYTYYRIKVRQNIDAGGSTSNDKWVKEGESVKIHAYPASGYEFTGWYKNGKHKSDDTDYKVKDVHEDRTYIAMFEKKEAPAPTTVKINVTVTPANAGIVTGNGEYTIGATAVLNAGPATGYVFDGWYYLGQLANKDALYTLPNLTVGYDLVANFVPASQVKTTPAKTPATKKTTTQKQETKEETKEE